MATTDAAPASLFSDRFDDRTAPLGAWDTAVGALTIEPASDAPSTPNVLHSVVPANGTAAFLTKTIATPGVTAITCSFVVKPTLVANGTFLTTAILRGPAQFPYVRLDFNDSEWHAYSQRFAGDNNGAGVQGAISAIGTWAHAQLELDAAKAQATIHVESQTDAIALQVTPDLSKLVIALGVHFPQAAAQEAYFDDLVCTAR